MEKLLAHISHLEVTSPDLEASVRFYTEGYGMREVHRDDDAAYLRCWGDYDLYSLVVRLGPEPSLARMAWRTTSDEALSAAAERLQSAGVDGRWTKGYGFARAFEFDGPSGHPMRLVWDFDKYEADEEHRSIYPDRPEKRSMHTCAPRFFDHVTVATQDVKAFCEWYRDHLGFRIMAYTDLDEAPVTVFGVLTTNEKSHDLGVVLDTSERRGRVNHVAFWVDTYEDLQRSADVLMEHGTRIEYGPSIHGIGEQAFLYFREPSGLRIELNSGGYRNYVPDWEPRTWYPAQGSNSMYRNSAMPMSMTESFPHADGFTATEEGASEEMRTEILNPYAKEGRG